MPWNTEWYPLHLLLITITLLIYAYISSKRKLSYWKNRNIPGPKPYPVIGNIWKTVSLQKFYGQLFKDFYDSGNGPVMGIFSFEEPILLIRSLDIVKQICLSDFQYFSDRISAAPKHNEVISNSLFMKKNPEWKLLRVKITPLFSSAKLKIMSDVIKEVGDSMVSFIKEHPGVHDGKILCHEYTTEVVSRCFYGINANCFQDEVSIIKQKSQEMFENTLRNSFCQFAYFFKPHLVDLLRLDFFSSSVQKFFVETFWKCLGKIEEGKMSSDSFIGFLREIRKRDPSFDGDQMASQGLAFFAAGTETTSSAISFTLYELCMNPDIQCKLRQEIENVIKNHGEFTYEVLQKMHYLEMCIIESLRKYPPLSILDRKCNEKYKIPGTDIIIEKGTGIYIPLLGIQNDPIYFPNPKKYSPERFINNHEASKMILSFGFGPRHCIGERFGMLSTKLALVYILRNFVVKQTPETPAVVEFSPKTVILASIVGLPLKFIPIN